jgi:sugar phosphate isomerase/epimerase
VSETIERQPDHGKLVGMSVVLLRDDLETACRTIRDLGFDAIEVHGSHISPGMPGVTVYDAHAAAAGELIRRNGLQVSTLNVVGDASFQPFDGPDALRGTAEQMGRHLRWAAAMGSPRILIWEGRVAAAADVQGSLQILGEVIGRARDAAGLADPPRVSIELHPFTFGLAHRSLPQLAETLRSIGGAGICFDFCHFAVALGRDLLSAITDDVLDAIDHVHYSDSDCVTSELHFPPGLGVLDLDAIGARLAGRPIATSWDLFGWPAPRTAITDTFDHYRTFVERHAASTAPSTAA